jgi:hypothetical protein
MPATSPHNNSSETAAPRPAATLATHSPRCLRRRLQNLSARHGSLLASLLPLQPRSHRAPRSTVSRGGAHRSRRRCVRALRNTALPCACACSGPCSTRAPHSTPRARGCVLSRRARTLQHRHRRHQERIALVQPALPPTRSRHRRHRARGGTTSGLKGSCWPVRPRSSSGRAHASASCTPSTRTAATPPPALPPPRTASSRRSEALPRPILLAARAGRGRRRRRWRRHLDLQRSRASSSGSRAQSARSARRSECCSLTGARRHPRPRRPRSRCQRRRLL